MAPTSPHLLQGEGEASKGPGDRMDGKGMGLLGTVKWEET